MKSKITTLIICAVLSAGAITAFAQATELESAGQTATCDASNTNKCVIYNVGEGTGKLVVSN